MHVFNHIYRAILHHTYPREEKVLNIHSAHNSFRIGTHILTKFYAFVRSVSIQLYTKYEVEKGYLKLCDECSKCNTKVNGTSNPALKMPKRAHLFKNKSRWNLQTNYLETDSNNVLDNSHQIAGSIRMAHLLKDSHSLFVSSGNSLLKMYRWWLQ